MKTHKDIGELDVQLNEPVLPRLFEVVGQRMIGNKGGQQQRDRQKAHTAEIALLRLHITTYIFRLELHSLYHSSLSSYGSRVLLVTRSVFSPFLSSIHHVFIAWPKLSNTKVIFKKYMSIYLCLTFCCCCCYFNNNYIIENFLNFIFYYNFVLFLDYCQFLFVLVSFVLNSQLLKIKRNYAAAQT